MIESQPAAFDVNPCADGYEVICTLKGHTVVKARPTRQGARSIATNLNNLLASGDRKAFARALGVYN
jgi:hypothetical protein